MEAPDETHGRDHVVPLEAGSGGPAHAPDSELMWSVPTAKTDRAFNWGRAAIAPDAVGKVLAGNLEVPFYLEYELRTRYPRGVRRRLKPYMRYYWSHAPEKDQPPFPITLFVVDTHEVEETFRNTAAAMSLMTHPVLVSCRPALQMEGILGRSWYPLWERSSPRLSAVRTACLSLGLSPASDDSCRGKRMLPESTLFALPAGWELQNGTIEPPHGISRGRILGGPACTTLWTG